MTVVTVSPKYQVVIPQEVRESMGIKPGEKVQVFRYEDRIEFVPVRKMSTLRGLVKGINTSVKREKDRV
ncbi:MAG: AbrB/MazE/SpoVT family DNA-binding domain-containing protein [Nitrospinota bacterium]|nr:AbrB/MazE/SpoVT family DNA-binding domain-containing protein [Nitrospinota bacterium]